MKASDVMTRDIYIASPEDTLKKAAQMMAEFDIRILPVVANKALLGVITDRDLAVRGLAKGLGAAAKVGEIMHDDPQYCFADQDITEINRGTNEAHIRRMPVLDHNRHVIGLLSLSDNVLATNEAHMEDALNGITRASREESQPAGTKR